MPCRAGLLEEQWAVRVACESAHNRQRDIHQGAAVDCLAAGIQRQQMRECGQGGCLADAQHSITAGASGHSCGEKHSTTVRWR